MAPDPLGYEEWTARQNRTIVSVDDHELDMAYYDEGETDPVVFLHGIPTWSYLWRHTVPYLESDRRVIAPDMLGYGNSAMFDGFDRSIRAQEVAVLDLLDQLDVDTFDIVAHDIGGGVAQRIAWHTDRVEKLVISNAVMFDAWPVEAITDLGLPANINGMSVDEVVGTLDNLFREGLLDPDDEFVEAMTSRYASDEGRISLARNAISTNTNHTVEIDYDSIDAETRFVWGKKDGFMRIELAEHLNDQLDNAQGVVSLDASHWVPEDKPDEYARHVIEFLS